MAFEISTNPRPNAPFLLFEKKRNHTTIPAIVGDGDKSTWTSETTVICDIRDKNGNPTSFDSIFVRCASVTAYEINLDGTPIGTRTLPETIAVFDAFPPIPPIPILRYGWQHDLLILENAEIASEVTLNFLPADANLNISEVLLLKNAMGLLSYNYTSLTHEKADVGSSLIQTQSGSISRILKVAGDRLRWRTTGTLEFEDNDEAEVFSTWLEGTREIVVAHDAELYPWRVYRARFLNSAYDVPYRTHILEQGTLVSFQVQEQRALGTQNLGVQIGQFNDVDSPLTLLQFFKDCKHLLPNRVRLPNGTADHLASDNNFETFSTEKQLIFDIAEGGAATRVTHIWLKSVGVTEISLQTEVGGEWQTAETVTLQQREQAGWEHSLTFLSSPIEAKQVQLVFVGTDTKVLEVMLLEFAGGLAAVTEMRRTKVDRTVVQSESAAGDIYKRPLGTARLKWQLDISAVFADGDLHAIEDFLDWAEVHPNFTLAVLAAQQPWEVYPATFLNQGFQITRLSDTIQIGEVLRFQVGER